MKKAGFLAKLHEEKKLQLVEPSEAIKDSYLEKSASNLFSAKLLLKNNCLEEAVSLAYYSMYHSLTALLFRAGIKCENHTGAIILLKGLFGIDNSGILFAKKERVDKQYYTDFHVTRKEVELAIRGAEEFNSLIHDFISRLNSGSIQEFRKRLKAFF